MLKGQTISMEELFAQVDYWGVKSVGARMLQLYVFPYSQRKTTEIFVSQSYQILGFEPYIEVLSGQILASNYECSNLFGFRDLELFMIFFHFGGKTNRNSQPYSGGLSGYTQGLQIWSPSMTAQKLFVFEILRFFYFIFFQNPRYKQTKPNLSFSFIL